MSFKRKTAKVKKADDFYSKRVDEIFKKVRQLRGENIKTEKQAKNWMDWEDIVKLDIKGIIQEKLEELQTKIDATNRVRRKKELNFQVYKAYQELAFFTLYLTDPINLTDKSNKTTRLEFHNYLITTNEAETENREHNYVLVKDNSIQMVLNTFKNKKYRGGVKWLLNEEDEEIIRDWLEYKSNVNDTHLFWMYSNKLDQSFDGKKFGDFYKNTFKKYTGKEIRNNLLRQIKSTFIDDYCKKKTLTANQIVKLHHNLLHSVEEGLRYCKRDNVEQEIEDIAGPK